MNRHTWSLGCFALLSCIAPYGADAGGLRGSDNLSAPWDPGREDCSAPDTKHLEVQYFSPDTILLRQNPCYDSEANLLYLIIGAQRALLIDSGAVENADPPITALRVKALLEKVGAGDLPLLVAHTHGHLDHRAGDASFAALGRVEIAPIESEPLRQFFGFKDWPNDVVQVDLGARIVDLIATPGHHQDHIVFYDRNSGLLFSGDFLLPGRLLVEDLDAYRDSARRMAKFAESRGVSNVLGAHVEMDQDGNLYPQGSTWHPNEHVLPLDPQDLMSLPAALDGFNGFYSRHPKYVIVNPMHNLAALAAGILLAITLLVWIVRRLWKRRRGQPPFPSERGQSSATTSTTEG